MWQNGRLLEKGEGRSDGRVRDKNGTADERPPDLSEKGRRGRCDASKHETMGQTGAKAETRVESPEPATQLGPLAAVPSIQRPCCALAKPILPLPRRRLRSYCAQHHQTPQVGPS